MDRKPKFRSRKLEYNRPLPVYRHDDSVDIDDYDNPMRAVPLMATGVDKEEEEEHHLQVALTAAQVTPKDQSYMIPTPEAAVQISDYDLLYPAVLKQRKGFIRHTGTIEDLSFLQSKYIADQEDLNYLNCRSLGEVSDKLKIFEHVLECFEDAANKFSEGIVSIDSSLERIKNDLKLNSVLERQSESELESWLNYWKEKRKLNVCSLVPSLKFEDVGKIGSDPYVCFRRRELKQPRKTRRSDAQVMEKIKKIHYDLDSVRSMLVAGIKRDKYKKESFLLETEAFEKYWTLRTWQQEYGLERPSTLPSFKSFHSQTPIIVTKEQAKLNSNPGANNKKRSQKKMSSSSETESGADENEDDFMENSGNFADLIKISIPPVAIKSVQYSRPYYPFEVVKQIQKDVEALLMEDGGFRDYSADLGSISRANCDLRRSRERLLNFQSNSQEREEMIKNRHMKDEKVLVLRRKGRCGRFVQSETRSSIVSPVLNFDEYTLKERIRFPGSLNHLRSIQARDCAHLNNAFVGNYNQHYIQCTGNLTVPTSLPSWISATSGLLQSKEKDASSGSNKSSSSTSANKPSSPNKKKRPANEEGSSEEGTFSKKPKATSSATATTTNTESTISNLTASPQFTVKVKSKMEQSSSSGIDEEDDLDGVTEIVSRKSSLANAARFTPTGLQKETKGI